MHVWHNQVDMAWISGREQYTTTRPGTTVTTQTLPGTQDDERIGAFPWHGNILFKVCIQFCRAGIYSSGNQKLWRVFSGHTSIRLLR